MCVGFRFSEEEQVIKEDIWICIEGLIQEVSLDYIIGLIYGPYSINERANMWHSHPKFKKMVKEEWKKLRELGMVRKLKGI